MIGAVTGSLAAPRTLLLGRYDRAGRRLNLVERWFAELTCRKLRRSAHRSVVELERDIRGWINE